MGLDSRDSTVVEDLSPHADPMDESDGDEKEEVDDDDGTEVAMVIVRKFEKFILIGCKNRTVHKCRVSHQTSD